MAERILLLQGPVGPFFRRFAAELASAGCEVFKINFNGGDAACFRGPNAVDFRGRPGEWRGFLQDFVRSRQIDRIYVFGDTRAHHRIARDVARELGIRFFVFEEGYLRPDFVTLEEGGVNGESSLPRDPDFYRWQDAETLAPRRVGNVFGRTAWHATVYYIATTLLHRRFPHYRHHRRTALVPEALAWLRSLARRLAHRGSDRALLRALLDGHSKRFFLVPLQVHCDAQVVVHSPFCDVSEFIETVARSFARNAPADRVLVFKHHPLDRAYRDYGALLGSLAAELGLGDRLRYAHDLHLPTLLRHAEGVVTVNSTAGASALLHGVPTKVLGDAVYDLPGLTSQCPLDAFWASPEAVDRDLYRRFSAYVRRSVLANGSFYRALPGVASPSGICWVSTQHLPHSLRFALGTQHGVRVQPRPAVATPARPRTTADAVARPSGAEVPAAARRAAGRAS
ncbi:MAG: capsular biosynthesis protein [Steroidobacteraceae bacterium]|nr:capsular biosynthesis protein [Steroidobacteraceae bacterium]